MKVKEESEKLALKLNIQNTKIMASSPRTSWRVEREKVEAVTDFILGGSKITVNGHCSYKIKMHTPLMKAMTNVDSVFKSRDYFSDKVSYSQSYGFIYCHVQV